jgi:hypothetical protein
VCSSDLDVMAGKPAKQALEEWYKNYTPLMKGAKKEGW